MERLRECVRLCSLLVLDSPVTSEAAKVGAGASNAMRFFITVGWPMTDCGPVAL